MKLVLIGTVIKLRNFFKWINFMIPFCIAGFIIGKNIPTNWDYVILGSLLWVCLFIRIFTKE